MQTLLRILYYGPAAMEEIYTYDPSLVVGVIGGSAGTTNDAFELLHSAKSYGARVALFGRKISTAEHQLSVVEHLRRVADDEILPAEASGRDFALVLRCSLALAMSRLPIMCLLSEGTFGRDDGRRQVSGSF